MEAVHNLKERESNSKSMHPQNFAQNAKAGRNRDGCHALGILGVGRRRGKQRRVMVALSH